MSNRWTKVMLAAALTSTAAGGYFAGAALSQSTPVKTETITIRNGEPGPAGPAGPQGPKGEDGGTTCPKGFVFGKLIINHPGGQTTIFTCLEDK